MRLFDFASHAIHAAITLFSEQQTENDPRVDLCLGCLAIGVGQPDKALIFFDRAMAKAQAMRDTTMIHLLEHALTIGQDLRSFYEPPGVLDLPITSGPLTVSPSASITISNTITDTVVNTIANASDTLSVSVTGNTLDHLSANLFGPFRATMNDKLIDDCPNSHGRAVFAYLLAHRTAPTPSEVLMDVFWPNASPKSARNNLHVAVHSLRQTLLAVTDQPIILFGKGTYKLNPNLEVWLDSDEFEKHVRAGRTLAAAGKHAEAICEYGAAIHLYRGDFLADDPYEEWAVLRREQLRAMFLDTTDQLSHIHFDRADYAACIGLCQLILAQDTCREDIHCRLMMCFVQQNQQHLALRQYHICVEALRQELDVAPAATTHQLYERIRARQSL
jgi:DNA-binding SARP family transcriptional activator